jgi:hypothetical protein
MDISTRFEKLPRWKKIAYVIVTMDIVICSILIVIYNLGV